MTHKEHEPLKLNGITVDEGIHKLVNAYLAHEAHGDKAVPVDHPLLERQDRLTTATEGIEKIVKDSLGDAKRLDPHNPADVGKADALIKSLIYEFAKTKRYAGKMEDMTSQEISDYLQQLGSATNDPRVGSIVEFRKSILNMPVLRPGASLYNKDSPIGHVIQYIAAQNDKPTAELQHAESLFQQHASDPRYVLATSAALSRATGKHYNEGASMGEVIADLRQAGELQAQKMAQERSKTYTAPAHAPGH